MALDTTHITGSPKTTALGLLGGLLGMSGAISGLIKFDQTGHFAMTPQAWFNFAVGIAFAVHASLMPDPDKQLAQTKAGIEDVDAHKIPDSTTATPVDASGNPVAK